MNVMRGEHPFPQMVRENWVNLNGEWEFEFDNSRCGRDKEFYKRNSLDGKINVPFCPESKLSGIEVRDFIYCVWYRKEFVLPEALKNQRILLHFGAVDYYATVYINGEKVTEHKGGYSSFSADITKYLKDGVNVICVCAEDDTRSPNYPSGKQSQRFESKFCSYTRTTGIWQTVWLEAVGKTYVKNFRAYTDIDNNSVMFRIDADGDFTGKDVKATVYYDGKKVGVAKTTLPGRCAFLNVLLSEIHLWDIGKGNLYDVIFEISDNDNIIDTVKCYFGMRTASFSDKGFLLNGRIVFGRWVLDQGYYPDGVYTAPSDEALKNDILYSMELGFNGARLHQKVFEPRFLYWADKLGYLVWGEFPSWGIDIGDLKNINNFLPEWLEVIDRDFSHPSIIGWCPLNEVREVKSGDFVSLVYNATKAADPTRTVVDTSGYVHSVSFEIYDVHDYESDYKKLNEYYSELDKGIINDHAERTAELSGRQKYCGEPVFISEYGGIKWDTNDKNSWGYGDDPKTEEEFKERYKNLTETIMANKKICAMCYTQLYDVEQECNGFMTYERKFKFPPEYFREINTQKAQ